MASSLKDYLKRYTSNAPSIDDSGKGKSKKKLKVKGTVIASRGVIIVDDDALWQKEQNPDQEDELDEDGDGPVVTEDVEVKRMQRMEALKIHRPYLSVANDGSGWVTVSNDDPEAARDPRTQEDGSNVSLFLSSRAKSPDSSDKRRRSHSSLSPRRKKHDSPVASPLRREGSEVSPTAKTFRRSDSPDLSPPRRRHDSPDLSPPRRRQDSPDLSPPRRRRGSSDVSPSSKRRDSPVLFPPRRRHDSADLSPPKRSRDSPELSPQRRRCGSPNMSAPRTRHDSLDLSPPRRRHDFPEVPKLRKPEDNSSSKRLKLSLASSKDKPQDSPTSGNSVDLTILRRRHDSPDVTLRSRVSEGIPPPSMSKSSAAASKRNKSQDLFPPPKRSDSARLSPPTSSKKGKVAPDDAQDLSPPRKKISGRMTDGTVAGLKSDRDVISDAEEKKAAEAKSLSELDPFLSGRGAQTVFRDKRGRRLEGLEEMLRQQKGEMKPPEEPLEWGKGLAQKRQAAADVAELEAEKSKPFARYRDDAELDTALKERVRWGDPMAHLVKKKVTEPVLEDLGAREEMKASGFLVPQDIPQHSWLKRGIAPPPNRYGIKPGRHWDGVDRSTGFEQGLFKQKNEKKARDLEAYLWSVSDM